MSSISHIAAAATAQSEAVVQSQISTSVAAKQLDTQRQIGDAVQQLLDESVQLSKAAGLGVQIDKQG